MNEIEEIKRRYSTRKKGDTYSLLGKNFHYVFHTRKEVEMSILECLHKLGIYDCTRLKFLEIGAGHGHNLWFFKNLGFEWEHMTAAELLPERSAEINKNFPLVKLISGDANLMEEEVKYDIIFQSTVFTSILDDSVKKNLAKKMTRMLSPGGIVIWYDFVFDNPGNKDVKGVKKREIRELFDGCKQINFHPITLAPPIGRRIGKLYPLVNFLFPFLRSHVLAVIK